MADPVNTGPEEPKIPQQSVYVPEQEGKWTPNTDGSVTFQPKMREEKIPLIQALISGRPMGPPEPSPTQSTQSPLHSILMNRSLGAP